MSDPAAAPSELPVPPPRRLEPIRACKNCDTPLDGSFCARCGQREIDLDRSLFQLLGEAGGEVLQLDARWLRSLRTTLLEPGRIALDWMDGRRARWSSPIRLYLLALVIGVLGTSFAAERLIDAGVESGAIGVGRGVVDGAPADALSFYIGDNEAREYVLFSSYNPGDPVPGFLRGYEDDPGAATRRMLAELLDLSSLALIPAMGATFVALMVLHHRARLVRHALVVLHCYTTALFLIPLGVAFPRVAWPVLAVVALLHGYGVERRVYQGGPVSSASRAGCWVALSAFGFLVGMLSALVLVTDA